MSGGLKSAGGKEFTVACDVFYKYKERSKSR